MNKKVSISAPQLCLMLFISRIISFITYSSYITNVENVWQLMAAILPGVIISLLMIIPVYFLDKGGAVNGAVMKAAGIIYGLYFLWVLVYTLTMFNFFAASLLNPTVSSVILSAAVVVSAVYGAYKGIEAISRASTVVFVITVAALIFLMCTLIPKTDLTNFYTPITHNAADTVTNVEFLICVNAEIPALAILLPIVKSKHKKAMCAAWTVSVYAVMAALIFFITGVLGDYVATQVFPVYSLTSVAGVGVLERLDGIFLGIWTAGMFVKMSLFIYLFSACVKQVLGDIASRISILVCGGAVFAIGCFTGANPGRQLGYIFGSGILMCLTATAAVVVPFVLIIARKLQSGKVEKI